MEIVVPRLSSICRRCRHSLRLQHPPPSLLQAITRQFTTFLPRLADTNPPPATPSPFRSNPMSSLLDAIQTDGKSSISYDLVPHYIAPLNPPHHLHIYATKHNTHITLTRPDRGPIISVSAGNIGFRKAARGTYDAAYQLGAYFMGRIQQQGLLSEIQYVEVLLRGFGPGREAVGKVLLGSEGRNLRPRVVRVTDATRLKFGGTRSKKPRRLG